MIPARTPWLAWAVVLVLGSASALARQDDEAPALEIPEAQVQVDLEPEEITVGDAVTVSVRLIWPAGAPDVEPRFPAWQDTWGQAEILSTGPVQRTRGAGGDVEFLQTLEITAFEVGETALPRVTLALPFGETTREIQTPADLSLTVRSVLPESEEAAEPLPAAAAEGLPIGRRFAWTAGLLTALCVLAAWRALHRQPATAGLVMRRTPRLPPLDELRRGLSGVDVEESEAAHTAISLALRTFVGRTAGVPAVERTTTEIGRLLRDSHLEPGWCQRLLTLLRRADEAKFVPLWRVGVETTRERINEAEAIAVALDEDLRRRREAAAREEAEEKAA